MQHDADAPNTQSNPVESSRCLGTCGCANPCRCTEVAHRLVSPFKITLALGLATMVGSFMILKPDPQGALANPTALSGRIPTSHLRDIVMSSGAVPDANLPASPDGWRSLGSLESDGLLIAIETRTDSRGAVAIAYTVSDRTGTVLATRVPIEELQSQFPRLDWDSLTAASPGRLMLADDPAPH